MEDPNNELSTTYRKVLQPNRTAQFMAFASLVIPGSILRAIPLSHNNNIAEASRSIRAVARDLIRGKKEKLQDKPQAKDIDILSVALESGYFSDEGLVNQLMTFLAAGHGEQTHSSTEPQQLLTRIPETTATGLIWATFLLCKHPDVQARLRKEVREMLPSPNSDTAMTVQTLDACSYLHAVCNEVLRLYAPVPIILRVADKDTSLLGQFIPKGTDIMVPIWAINTSIELWGPDALEFNPERWIGPGKANSGGAESNYAFMTFIHGPRSCIGQQFAKAEFGCLVAALVGSFQFELEDPEMDIKIQGGITAKPRYGLKVRMKPLEGW